MQDQKVRTINNHQSLLQTCLLIAALLTLPFVVQAQFNFTTTNGTITITGYTGSGGDVAIPATINGLPVTSIGTNAFMYCRSLTRVTIPNSVINIGDSAFYECEGLTSVTIPNSVTSIGDVAFAICHGLTSVTIPNRVNRVGGGAFNGCTSLTNVTIGSGVTNIEAGVFSDCQDLTSITIPNSVTSIGDDAFDDCYSLANITIPNSVISIGYNAFIYSGLAGITIPNSVTSIRTEAFAFCNSLTNVIIGNGVTSIGDFAFLWCTSLTSVTIPNSVTNMWYNAFYDCASLIAINVDAANPFYASVAGVLFDKSLTTLILYPMGRAGGYTIPDGVTSIGVIAFFGCPLTNATIPNSVTNIGGNAFSQCRSLTSILFKGNAPSIDTDPFSWRFNVDDVHIRVVYDPATIYYLPGTTGWSDYFAGLPTALWLPQVQTGDASFGVRSNQFGFNINWASGQTVVVEACTDLAYPVWTPVATNTFATDSVYFSDPQWINYPARFYRLRSP
jgi:hypothetical protein